MDRMPDELWMEVCDIVEETGIKTILKKKSCKKAKWLSGEALQKQKKRNYAVSIKLLVCMKKKKKPKPMMAFSQSPGSNFPFSSERPSLPFETRVDVH